MAAGITACKAGKGLRGCASGKGLRACGGCRIQPVLFAVKFAGITATSCFTDGTDSGHISTTPGLGSVNGVTFLAWVGDGFFASINCGSGSLTSGFLYTGSTVCGTPTAAVGLMLYINIDEIPPTPESGTVRITADMIYLSSFDGSMQTLPSGDGIFSGNTTWDGTAPITFSNSLTSSTGNKGFGGNVTITPIRCSPTNTSTHSPDFGNELDSGPQTITITFAVGGDWYATLSSGFGDVDLIAAPGPNPDLSFATFITATTGTGNGTVSFTLTSNSGGAGIRDFGLIINDMFFGFIQSNS